MSQVKIITNDDREVFVHPVDAVEQVTMGLARYADITEAPKKVQDELIRAAARSESPAAEGEAEAPAPIDEAEAVAEPEEKGGPRLKRRGAKED